MDSTTFAILVVLIDRQLTASGVHDELHAVDGAGSVAVATFYRRLNAALNAGWIVGREERATGRGRPGRQYALTDAGADAMRAEARRMRRLARLALRDETPR